MWSNNKKKKSKTPSEFRAWIKKCDAAWSAMIKRKLGYKCFKPDCTKTKGIQAHHVINDRTSYATRFDENNGLPLCSGHHKFWAETSRGQEPAREIIKKIIGEKEYQRIKSLENQSRHFGRFELKQLLWELNHKYLEKEKKHGK